MSFRQRGYFLSIMTFFTLFSVVLILLSTVYFMNKITHIMNEAFAEKHQKSVSQVSYLFDNLHAQLIPGLKEASYNNYSYTNLMYSHELESYQLLEGLEGLDAFLISYPMIQSIYLYNGQMNFFLTTSSGIEEASSFYDKEVLTILTHFNMDFVDYYWPRMARYTMTPYSSIIIERPTLTLLMGTTPSQNTHLKGALIINLNMDEITSLLSAGTPDSRDVLFIYNQNGDYITQSGDRDRGITDEIYSLVRSQNKEQGLILQGESLITYQFNYHLGWYFMGIMPLDGINNDIKKVGKTVFLVMFFLMLLASLLSYLSACRIYRPINKLLNFVSDTGNRESFLINANNEISHIQNRYKQILFEKDSLEDSLNSLSADYRIEIIRSLLEGNEYHFWIEELPLQDQKLISGSLVLYLFQIDNFYDECQNWDFAEFRNHRIDVIDRIKNELNTKDEILVDMTGQNFVCLIPGNRENSQVRMETLHSVINRESCLSLTMSWEQRIKEETKSLNQIYEKTVIRAGEKFISGGGRIQNGLKREIIKQSYPSKLTDSFLQKLRQGSRDESLEQLELLSLYLAQGSYGEFLDYISHFTFRLLIFLQGRGNKSLLSDLYQVRANPKVLETLEKFKTFYSRIILDYLEETDREQQKGRHHIVQIESLMEKHYLNESFCVQSLSQMTKLSPNYLRKIYKQYSDLSLSDRITQLRLEEAARLLKETDLSIKDIYSRAGFTNYNSFFTSFKKFSSLTPAIYRKKYHRD